MIKTLPKVLVVAINAWRTDAPSHTLMNIFSCWDSSRLAMIYTRADLPNTNVCSRFFQISENDVLKSVFKPWVKTGREVFNTHTCLNKGIEEEHKRYAKARKEHSYFLSFCREMVWRFGHWKSKELRNFVKDFDPDIIFVPIYPTEYMGRIQRYIKKLTGKQIVCYLADDNYSYESCKGFWSYVHRFMLRKQVKYLATNCKEMFVIVDKEKEETDKLFGTNSVILTKGVDFTNRHFEERPLNKPLKFVYTGNLIIGRDKSLAIIADMLNKINGNETKAVLEIYSPDIVDEETMEKLNSGCSRHCGFVPKERIEEIQKNADVLIFAEAINGKYSNAARLSFSTKITDYLSNGKCVFAVGKKDIAPIDYFIKNDSAIVATSYQEVEDKLKCILMNPSLISEYAHKSFECAKKNHDKNIIDKRFIETICRNINND